jgi:hypothetical protein
VAEKKDGLMLTWGESVTPETSRILSAALSVSTSRDATLDTTEPAFLVMRWFASCTRKMLSLNYLQVFIKPHVRDRNKARRGLYKV